MIDWTDLQSSSKNGHKELIDHISEKIGLLRVRIFLSAHVRENVGSEKALGVAKTLALSDTDTFKEK